MPGKNAAENTSGFAPGLPRSDATIAPLQHKEAPAVEDPPPDQEIHQSSLAHATTEALGMSALQGSGSTTPIEEEFARPRRESSERPSRKQIRGQLSSLLLAMRVYGNRSATDQLVQDMWQEVGGKKRKESAIDTWLNRLRAAHEQIMDIPGSFAVLKEDRGSRLDEHRKARAEEAYIAMVASTKLIFGHLRPRYEEKAQTFARQHGLPEEEIRLEVLGSLHGAIVKYVVSKPDFTFMNHIKIHMHAALSSAKRGVRIERKAIGILLDFRLDALPDINTRVADASATSSPQPAKLHLDPTDTAADRLLTERIHEAIGKTNVWRRRHTDGKTGRHGSRRKDM